jgi:hypothetical protein
MDLNYERTIDEDIIHHIIGSSDSASVVLSDKFTSRANKSMYEIFSETSIVLLYVRPELRKYQRSKPKPLSSMRSHYKWKEYARCGGKQKVAKRERLL